MIYELSLMCLLHILLLFIISFILKFSLYGLLTMVVLYLNLRKQIFTYVVLIIYTLYFLS